MTRTAFCAEQAAVATSWFPSCNPAKRKAGAGFTGSESRDRIAHPGHKIGNQAEPLRFFLNHPFKRSLLQGLEIDCVLQIRRYGRCENVEQAIDRMQSTPEIIVLARRAAEKAAEACERSTQQHPSPIRISQADDIVRTDAVDQYFLDRPGFKRHGTYRWTEDDVP